MKRKLVTLSLATVLALSCTACGPELTQAPPAEVSSPSDASEGSSEEITDSTENSSDLLTEETASESSTADDFDTLEEKLPVYPIIETPYDFGTTNTISFGHSDATTHTYENQYFGIGLKLDDSWTLETDEELWNENDLDPETDAATAIAAQEENIALDDLYAFNEQSCSYICAFQKMDKKTREGTLEDYFDVIEKELSTYSDIEQFSDLSMERTTTTIDGVEFRAFQYKVAFGEKTFEIIQFPIIKGDYLLTVTISSQGGANLDDLLGALYLIRK